VRREGASFEDDVGASAFDPLAKTFRGEEMRRLRGAMIHFTNGQGVQPSGSDEQPVRRWRPREAPAEVLSGAGVRLLEMRKGKEGDGNVAEKPNDCRL